MLQSIRRTSQDRRDARSPPDSGRVSSRNEPRVRTFSLLDTCPSCSALGRSPTNSTIRIDFRWKSRSALAVRIDSGSRDSAEGTIRKPQLALSSGLATRIATPVPALVRSYLTYYG